MVPSYLQTVFFAGFCGFCKGAQWCIPPLANLISPRPAEAAQCPTHLRAAMASMQFAKERDVVAALQKVAENLHDRFT